MDRLPPQRVDDLGRDGSGRSAEIKRSENIRLILRVIFGARVYRNRITDGGAVRSPVAPSISYRDGTKPVRPENGVANTPGQK